MLYNKDWDVKTKPDVHSVSAWLETKSPKENYNWGQCGGSCLLGQYMAAHGIDWYGTDIHSPYCAFVDLASTKNGFDLQLIAINHPWTFGAALDRARKLQQQGA